MSREIYYYEKVEAQTAFLAGVADISLNSMLSAMDNPSVALETDIFYVGDKGVAYLYDAILERLKKYNEIDNFSIDLAKDPFMPELPLKKIAGTNIIDNFVKELYPKYTKSKQLQESMTSFYYSLSWYLNPAKALWKADMQVLSSYLPSLEEALALSYTYIVTDVYFLEFRDYIFMLVVGSNE